MLKSIGEQISSTTKAKLRKGTLMNGEYFRRLLSCSKVSDVAHLLLSSYYAGFLPANAESLHRDKFESLLIKVISSEVYSFFSYVGTMRYTFLKLWLEKQIILLIKRKVWEIYAKKTNLDIEPETYKDLLSLHFSLVDIQELLSSKRISDVIASIKNKILIARLEESMKRSTGGTSPALMIEFTLDEFQNSRLFEAVKDFSGAEKEGLLSLIGIEMDIINITSVYRGKKYFNMSDEEALSVAVYSQYRVQFKTLKEIAALPPELMWGPLAGTLYASLLPTEAEDDAVSEAAYITHRIRSIQRLNALKTFGLRGSGIHFVLAYLMLRELEIQDINAVIEIVRYNYDRNKAGMLLAYPIAAGW